MFVLLAVTTSGVDAWRFSDLVHGVLCVEEVSPQKLLRSCVGSWAWLILWVPVFSTHMASTTAMVVDRSGWMMSPAEAMRHRSVTAPTVSGESTLVATTLMCF